MKQMLAAAALLACACSQPKTPEGAGRVHAIVGPDGSQMLHISCGEDEGLCYQIAGANCPSGYDVGLTHTQQRGNFFVRCRPPNPYGSEWSQRGPNTAPRPNATPEPGPPATPAADASPAPAAKPAPAPAGTTAPASAEDLFNRRD